MENHLYLNIHITDNTNETVERQNSRAIASVFVNSASRTISIIDNTQILLNSSTGLFAGVDVTDLGQYLQETKELIRCNHNYTQEDIRNAFIVTIKEYNETRKDNIKLIVS